jgi:hypothetical protein
MGLDVTRRVHALQEQSSLGGVGLEQTRCPVAVPGAQRFDLGRQLGVGHAQLEDHTRAIARGRRRDPVVREAVERLVQRRVVEHERGRTNS